MLYELFCFRNMPSLFQKREAPAGTPLTPVEQTVSNVNPSLQPGTTELPPEVSTETGGKPLEPHIFGNKKYHPSHGRTTPFPEPGISYVIIVF